MEIKKSYNLMNAVKMDFRIADGVRILTTNNPEITKQIFNNFLKEKPNIIYNKEQHAIIEKHAGKKAEEILAITDEEMKIAEEQGKKARGLRK